MESVGQSDPAKKIYNGFDKDGFLSRKFNADNQFQGHSLKPIDFKYTQNSFSDQSHALTAYAEKMIVRKKARKTVDHPKPKCLPVPASNVIFNMNNDLAYAYSLCNICDKGEDPKSS